MNINKCQLVLCILVGFNAFSCNNSKNQDGHLKLIGFEVLYKGGYSDLRPINDSPVMNSDEEGITIISVEHPERCSFTKEDFNGFVRLTKDTVFLFVDYNWVGEQRIGVMDICVNKYVFKISNYPDSIPFKVIYD